MAVQFSRKELAGVRFLVGALMSSDNLDRLMRDLRRILDLIPPSYWSDEPEVNWMRDGF
jgi:hypothetical protein